MPTPARPFRVALPPPRSGAHRLAAMLCLAAGPGAGAPTRQPQGARRRGRQKSPPAAAGPPPPAAARRPGRRHRAAAADDRRRAADEPARHPLRDRPPARASAFGVDRDFDSFKQCDGRRAVDRRRRLPRCSARSSSTPIILLIGIIWYKLRKTRMQNETMLKLAERGVVPPAEAVDARDGRHAAGAGARRPPSRPPPFEQAVADRGAAPHGRTCARASSWSRSGSRSRSIR